MLKQAVQRGRGLGQGGIQVGNQADLGLDGYQRGGGGGVGVGAGQGGDVDHVDFLQGLGLGLGLNDRTERKVASVLIVNQKSAFARGSSNMQCDHADPLEPLLAHFGARARLFFAGSLCGDVTFSDAQGMGYLHLLRAGTAKLHDESGYVPSA